MGSGTATQKLFEVREDATNYGGLCSPVVLESVQQWVLFQLFGGFLELKLPGSV